MQIELRKMNMGCGAMQGYRDRRMYERYRFRGLATMTWTADGVQSTVVGNCGDISVSGMLVEMPKAAPVGAQVSVEIDGAPFIPMLLCAIAAIWRVVQNGP